MEMASIGALPGGGVNRPAYADIDARARRELMQWAEAIGLDASLDPIGNLFLRMRGRDDSLPPVVTGSHLDTQPEGGKFDGAYGVIAGMEALTAIHESGWTPNRPLELAVWANEEGSRFAPTTMGSSVFAGAMTLEQATASEDEDGTALGEVLARFLSLHGEVPERPLGTEIHAYVEAHIEQGPLLERASRSVGVVTGIQGLRWFEVEVRGEEAHAGTTPRLARRDAQAAAIRAAAALAKHFEDDTDTARFTIGRWHVEPGSPNTVPGRVVFTIDFRHPDPDLLQALGDAVAPICRREASPCECAVRELSRSEPIHFPNTMQQLIGDAARAWHIEPMALMSGATHDAKPLHLHTRTGMIFVPCAGGISHNQAESATAEDLADGAQVLCESLTRLAR